MASTITITYKDKDYTLRYSRATIIKMEKDGFNVEDYAKTPVTTALQLFAGAFRAEHPSVRQSLIEEIYDSLGNKGGLMDALIEMYIDVAMKTLTDDAEPEKNPGWVLNETP